MKQGDVYWVTLNPTQGFEIQGKGVHGQRPCVIVSPDILNKNLKTVIIAPCTTTVKGLPFRVKIKSLPKPSEVALDQIRTVDNAPGRFGDLIGVLKKTELKECLRILRVIFSDD
jgi:mRNA interferase MazF